jgi:hypothetical protein
MFFVTGTEAENPRTYIYIVCFKFPIKYKEKCVFEYIIKRYDFVFHTNDKPSSMNIIMSHLVVVPNGQGCRLQ